VRKFKQWLIGKRFTLFDVICFAVFIPLAIREYGVWGFVCAFAAWAVLIELIEDA
jgi:hypothetical protein